MMRETRNNEDNVKVNSRHVSGYAIVFNSLSVDLGGFREVILPSAVDNELLNRSDIVALYEHNKDRGILARSRHNNGTLRLSIDERGLHYEFDCPETALGQEVAEALSRGDVSSSSFSFTVEKDRYERNAEGVAIRYIEKIKQLYDISVVANPAYISTSAMVDSRSYEAFLESENNNQTENIDTVENTENRSQEELLAEIESLKAQLRSKDESKEEEEEPKKDEEERSEEVESPKDEKDESEDDKEKESEEERNNNTNYNTISTNTMEKFSLIRAIRDIANGRSLDETAQKIVAEGRSEMAKAGLNAEGQIVLPSEYRADNTNGQTNSVFATVAGKGAENVETNLSSIIEPLYNALVTQGAGFTYMTGLVGNVEYPILNGGQCYWESETSEAKDANVSWDKIKSSPKRLSATLQVSKLFLAQDSNGAEELLKRDIIEALHQKLEATILQDGSGDNNTPSGLFNGVTASTTAFKYEDWIDMQRQLMSKNINNYKLVCSPSAYAVLRGTKLDSGSGRFLLENGYQTVDGINVYVTNNVIDKGMVLADFSQIIINQWSNISLVIDPYTLAASNMIKIVVNAYFDVVTRRPEAVLPKILK